METVQSSPANGPSKEEQEVISKKQVIGERGRSIEAKENREVPKESIEDTPFIKVFDLTLDMTHDMTESESEYYSSDESDEEDNEEDIERVLILEDAKELEKLATAFLHPEISVSVDCISTARCYFDRNSAPEQEDVEETIYKSSVLGDITALKKLATDYAHPEKKVFTEDPTAFGRNYFSMPSAVEQEDENDAEERTQVLADATFLKTLAVDYAHPERRINAIDSTVFARSYFSRASAAEQDDAHDADEMVQVLADAVSLKTLAVNYAHPEIKVSTTDPTAFGRNYFTILSFAKPLEVISSSPEEKQNTKFLFKNKILQKHQPVISKVLSGKDFSHNKLSEMAIDNVKRSPSSVILFGLGDDDGSAY